jgi:hypothetical protein
VSHRDHLVCEPINRSELPSGKGANVHGISKLGEDQRGDAPSFSRDQIDAMSRAFKQACARLRLDGATPVIELVAVRIVELARAGEFDPDKLTNTVVAEFQM